ncbi:MAG TPA: trypsin-like peptidase domain-containing protein [Aridibacter sp.]|nr:trypsin-like peptidase domain-containing protein [Aridibacter sp.]
MADGIIIHVSVGKERRTEYFGEEVIRIGSDALTELQIHSKLVKEKGVWLQIQYGDGVYRVIDHNEALDLTLNGDPIRRYVALKDGDEIRLEEADIGFSFFSLTSESSLITTNRDPHVAPFIEEAALEAAATEQRDDAKAFLREFSRELLSEISWTTKLIVFALVVAVLSAGFYLGYGFYSESVLARHQSAQQNEVINNLRNEIKRANDELGGLSQSNKDIIRNISLAPNLRVEYGNGVCLIVGVYDLVDRRSGKMLRYPDPASMLPDSLELQQSEEGIYEIPAMQGLTTEGSGTPVEYDFIGTGFHVGNGFIVTNRHVVQPWTEDDLVKQLMSENGGRARVKKLIVYFPGIVRPFQIQIKKLGGREDVAIASITGEEDLSAIPVLPLETDSDSVAIGKTVVSMGYPNGPDRLLTMVDDDEAKRINARFGNSRQALISYLAQTGKIAPLTTQGAITDLDSKRVVHDAKTAEGGSGAPLFGQSGKVIGVNFGVFTENTASNLAVPIRFAVSLLEGSGWTAGAPASQAQTTTGASKDKSGD